MYITTTLCFVGLMASGGALATYPVGGVPPKNPFFDSFLCNKEDSIPVCELKKSQCAGINQVFIGPGGPVGAVINCANETGAVPGPEFYLGIGLAFIKGTPEMLSDMVSSDPMVSREIRRCTLKSTGLLSPDMNINRPALGAALNASLTTPALSAASVAAAYSCPEPVDFKITEFMNCIKSACMSNVAVNPYTALGTSGPYPGNPNVGSSYQGGSPPAGAWVMQSTSQ